MKTGFDAKRTFPSLWRILGIKKDIRKQNLAIYLRIMTKIKIKLYLCRKHNQQPIEAGGRRYATFEQNFIYSLYLIYFASLCKKKSKSRNSCIKKSK
jgi:hypothetical protein